MKTKRKKEATPEQKAAAHAKRAELIALSQIVKKGMESGQFPEAEKVNDGIVSIYRDRTGKTDFRSFARWREEGFQVVKGSHGFPVWGKPRAATAGQEDGGGDEEARKYKLFPLAYLFHAEQVEPMDPTKPRAPRAPRDAKEDDEDAPTKNAALADRLRTLADGMDSEIEAKMNPAISNQNPTRRRHAIAESMRADGAILVTAQIILRAVAEIKDGGAEDWISELEARPSICTCTTKAAAIKYARQHKDEIKDAMRRAGAATAPRDDWKGRYRAALGGLIGAKYDGFFPTGDKLAKIMMEKAELRTGHALKILEPSAGTGNLALAIIDEIGANQSKVWTIETVPTLSAVLDIIAEGHPETVRNIGAMDFFDYEDAFSEIEGAPEEFDRIIMNPPFERGQDMAHVQAAHSLLTAGGILVAIMCANIQFRNDGEYPAFRDWLDSIGAEVEAAPEDSFSGTIRTTKTAAVIVTIRK